MGRTRLKKYSHEKLSASEKTSLAGSRATVGMQGMQQSGLLVRPDRFLEVLGSYEEGRDPARTRHRGKRRLMYAFFPGLVSFFPHLPSRNQQSCRRLKEFDPPDAVIEPVVSTLLWYRCFVHCVQFDRQACSVLQPR